MGDDAAKRNTTTDATNSAGIEDPRAADGATTTTTATQRTETATISPSAGRKGEGRTAPKPTTNGSSSTQKPTGDQAKACEEMGALAATKRLLQEHGGQVADVTLSKPSSGKSKGNVTSKATGQASKPAPKPKTSSTTKPKQKGKK